MNDMTKILAINGSYRDDGITDRTVEIVAKAVQATGAEVEVIHLREYPIEFCHNCRACTQQPGSVPGEYVLQDNMGALVKKIEKADAYILAAPTNLGSATSIFKRFMERLVVYAYWPWGKKYPLLRKAGMAKKKAILISSCAAPGVFGRWIFGTHKQLEMTAKTIGANTVGILSIGLVANESHQQLSERVQRKAKSLAIKLV